MSIRTLDKNTFCILHNDKLMRMGRMEDNKPFSFNTESEAEEFILDYRSTLIEQRISSKRWDYYIFKTDTDLGIIQ